jgi:hypothetical protein
MRSLSTLCFNDATREAIVSRNNAVVTVLKQRGESAAAALDVPPAIGVEFRPRLVQLLSEPATRSALRLLQAEIGLVLELTRGTRYLSRSFSCRTLYAATSFTWSVAMFADTSTARTVRAALLEGDMFAVLCQVVQKLAAIVAAIPAAGGTVVEVLVRTSLSLSPCVHFIVVKSSNADRVSPP